MLAQQRRLDQQLMQAAMGGLADKLAQALAQGANPDTTDSPGGEGWISLIWAAFGKPECLRLLLPVSNPLWKNPDGTTALMAALDEAEGRGNAGAMACVRILLPVSDLDAVDQSGQSVDRWAGRIEGSQGQLARHLIAAERERRALAAEAQKTMETARKSQDNQGVEALAKKPPRL